MTSKNITVGAASRLKLALGDLAFLKRNLGLLLFWPLKFILLALIGWHLLDIHLEQERADAESAALQKAETLSRAYAQHLYRALEAVDQLTLYVKGGWELGGSNFKLEKMAGEGLFTEQTGFYVSIIDANGNLRTSTIPEARRVNIATEPYFQVHVHQPDHFYVGTARLGNFSQTPVVPFSRRLQDASGRFDGIVLVSVAPDYFTSGYDKVALKEFGFLGILSADKVMRLARIGDDVFLPHTQRTALLRELPLHEPAGSAILGSKDWFTDKRARYVGWAATPGYKMITVSGLDRDSELAPYREERRAALRQGIAATILLGVITLVAMLASLHIAWRRQQLQTMQATYRRATEVGNDGFMIARALYDPRGNVDDFEIVDCNERGANLLRYRREELVGQKISWMYEGVAAERTMRMLCRAMKHRFYEGETETATMGIEGVPRWLHIRISRPNEDLAITLRDITELKSHVAELERRGNEDALTGLPNRHWLNAFLPKAVEQAAANRRMLALLFIDLDGFKAVNDTMGHNAGDEILRNAAQRLRDATRPQDYVVRIGGDEFLVILERIGHAFDAAQVADRVLDAFGNAFRVNQGVRTVGASIGISLYPIDGADANTLLNNADIAMYSVKSDGKGAYRFFDPRFSEAIRQRHRMEAELQHALDHDQFVMYYQPRVDVSTGITSSMEALVRWAHPERGIVGPNEFIPLAEETGLIIRLGEQVIEKVFAQVAAWAARGQELVPVSINVSARQFRESNVANTLASCLARYRVNPDLIEIELTESSMIDEGHNVIETLQAIQAMGIKLSVDDFGTGYSSLSQLQRLDFDVIKVDRAFTTELDKPKEGVALITAIITMAHALGMRVVAEGVETIEQIVTLKQLRCDEVQGYYISKPLPPSDTQPILPRWFFPSTT
ncbi:bifunctional diguanylate cyclase/phosphodiesterase [Noviherbaspirillum sp.]|uniref:bifunctional diguanylate cyclase/phosphodiesterase n=1 Tax=Noviherbaspirillum sp. TaxID=1926288 RepID=UPI002D233F49|nr:EAL domain-containing protein [Noviherbaspirillum sp.]HZW21375.1 EAL domain-containing protein [Noviherbaspirillum sp.]